MSKYIKTTIKEYLKEQKFLSKTNRGELYEDDGLIVKITSDFIEYQNALILIDNPNQYFVKYYSGEELEEGKYKLTMEKLDMLSDNEYDMVDLIQNSLGIKEYMLDDNKRYSFIKELKDNPEFYEDFATYKEMNNMILLLKRMYLEAESLGITLYDLRAENMGKREDGQIVHFDLGAG